MGGPEEDWIDAQDAGNPGSDSAPALVRSLVESRMNTSGFEPSEYEVAVAFLPGFHS